MRKAALGGGRAVAESRVPMRGVLLHPCRGGAASARE